MSLPITLQRFHTAYLNTCNLIGCTKAFPVNYKNPKSKPWAIFHPFVSGIHWWNFAETHGYRCRCRSHLHYHYHQHYDWRYHHHNHHHLIIIKNWTVRTGVTIVAKAILAAKLGGHAETVELHTKVTPVQMILSHDDVIKWKHFPRYWPFVREIPGSQLNFLHTKASDAELWRFLWSALEQTIVRLLIWDVIALIMTYLSLVAITKPRLCLKDTWITWIDFVM